jgi:Tfp pilus assembly protein PilO
MAKYYLYLLLSVFIFLNGIEYFHNTIKQTIIRQETLKSKLKKYALYESDKEKIELLIKEQRKLFAKNRKLFFKKSKNETIIFSEIQEQVQQIMHTIGGKITQLNSGVVVETKWYKKYPIALSIKLIPEDLDEFFKKINDNKKYFFIDDFHISNDTRAQMLRLKITLIGYQLK